MQPPKLVVSDPPHAKVDVDAAAKVIGLDVFQTRLKFIFPAPEILAASDGSQAAGIADSYREAGVSVAILDGEELPAVPWPDPVISFEFNDRALAAQLRHHTVELPYDSEVVGVYCKPPADFRAHQAKATVEMLSSGFEVVEAIEWTATLDLYFVRNGSVQRISIVRDFTDFSGLGFLQQRTVAQDMEVTVAECSRRFRRMHLDARLENVRPRRRFVGGDAASNPDMRQRYSFGTLLLRGILGSISPELADCTQYELGSRLGYLTSRARAG